jgi:hypothetical protein
MVLAKIVCVCGAKGPKAVFLMGFRPQPDAGSCTHFSIPNFAFR